jgi:DNA processing protein
MKDLLPWFTLKHTPGIGNYSFKKLIDRFGSPEDVFAAPHEDLTKIEGISSRIARAIKDRSISDFIKKDLDIAAHKNIKISIMTDNNYPSLLLELPDPPPIIYAYGSLDGNMNSIAIVGSRSATDYGILVAGELSKELASGELGIVSGMAKGIDTAAHKGALAAGGKTIAVLGSGLARIYPAENEKLFHEISENGAVISEFPMTMRPNARNFPLRNRIICGMSLGTVVVEAAERSGALITARLAAEQGKEVFAVPGSIKSKTSRGTHSLLKQGAKLVEHASDVIEELPHFLIDDRGRNSTGNKGSKTVAYSLAPDEELVFTALESYPMHIDSIVRKIGMEAGKLSGILLQLELKGIVHQSPGKYFSRRG